MKLTLTFTNKFTSMDFLMNDDIPIKDALDIISQNSDFQVSDNQTYIYSKRKDQKIHTNYSFKQAGIYSGDELITEDKR